MGAFEQVRPVAGGVRNIVIIGNLANSSPAILNGTSATAVFAAIIVGFSIRISLLA
jgi:hypothetical protein